MQKSEPRLIPSARSRFSGITAFDEKLRFLLFEKLFSGGLLLMRQPGFGVFLRAFYFSLFIVVCSILSGHRGTPVRLALSHRRRRVGRGINVKLLSQM
jgi:hypothetical protein